MSKSLSYNEAGRSMEWTYNRVFKEDFEMGKKKTRNFINFFTIGISFWDISLRQGYLIPDVSRQRNGLIFKVFKPNSSSEQTSELYIVPWCHVTFP